MYQIGAVVKKILYKNAKEYSKIEYIEIVDNYCKMNADYSNKSMRATLFP